MAAGVYMRMLNLEGFFQPLADQPLVMDAVLFAPKENSFITGVEVYLQSGHLIHLSPGMSARLEGVDLHRVRCIGISGNKVGVIGTTR